MSAARYFVLMGMLWAPLGCAQFEQYPHPYVPHSRIRLTQGEAASNPNPFPNHPSLVVCDLNSQVVVPVGGYFINAYLQRPLDLETNIPSLADVVAAELSSEGVNVLRINDPWRISGHGLPNASGAILTGDVLRMEYSQHGLKDNPYHFLLITVRFELISPDGNSIWRGDVSAFRKITPGPETSQSTVAATAIKEATRLLASNDSFRAAVVQSQKGI